MCHIMCSGFFLSNKTIWRFRWLIAAALNLTSRSSWLLDRSLIVPSNQLQLVLSLQLLNKFQSAMHVWNRQEFYRKRPYSFLFAFIFFPDKLFYHLFVLSPVSLIWGRVSKPGEVTVLLIPHFCEVNGWDFQQKQADGQLSDLQFFFPNIPIWLMQFADNSVTYFPHFKHIFHFHIFPTL